MLPHAIIIHRNNIASTDLDQQLIFGCRQTLVFFSCSNTVLTAQGQAIKLFKTFFLTYGLTIRPYVAQAGECDKDVENVESVLL